MACLSVRNWTLTQSFSEIAHPKIPPPLGCTTSFWMRSRRIYKRVLASPVDIVIVWVELPHSDDETYLLWDGLSRGRWWLLGLRAIVAVVLQLPPDA
ncbi:hypothetical protein AVEN_178238-1 [Araneus ventricosus]|uniref:Uncharacterized protein n=1 Tax=Araneus ventricosus TaxID=182803 RepID=A0A4Y2N4D8_ARAVE|nr:hypothetical protein AVEN_178238-1 [Araneus ventricosus]